MKINMKILLDNSSVGFKVELSKLFPGLCSLKDFISLNFVNLKLTGF